MSLFKQLSLRSDISNTNHVYFLTFQMFSIANHSCQMNHKQPNIIHNIEALLCKYFVLTTNIHFLYLDYT